MALSVGVVGGGTMGAGIAYAFAAAGCETTIVEPRSERADAVRELLRTVSEDGVRRGKLDVSQAAAIPDSVRLVTKVEGLAEGLDLVIETVPENMAIKREVLAAVEGRRPALLATNTSSISIDELASALHRPMAFLGMHFFNPVWAIQMVEVIRGAATDDAAIEAALAAVALIGKQHIVVRNVPGFATSRLDLIASLEAMRMLEDGVASAEDIDRAMVLAYRHPVGPLRLSDLVGLDVRLDIARSLAETYGPRYSPPAILISKVDAGELGQKSGRGFFDWS